MTRKEVFLKYKNIQKNRGKEILRLKNKRKELGTNGGWEINGNILKSKREFRFYHISICLLRGKKYEQIERKCSELNKLNTSRWDEIEKIKSNILNQIEDVINE